MEHKRLYTFLGISCCHALWRRQQQLVPPQLPMTGLQAWQRRCLQHHHTRNVNTTDQEGGIIRAKCQTRTQIPSSNRTEKWKSGLPWVSAAHRCYRHSLVATSVDWIYPAEQTHWWSKHKGAQMQSTLKKNPKKTRRRKITEFILFNSQTVRLK